MTLAASATASSVATTAPNVSGSVGVTPQRNDCSRRPDGQGRGAADRDAERRQHQAGLTMPRMTCDRGRAEREADAELARPLAHGAGDQAVDADRREQQRHAAERRRPATS